MPQWQTHNVPHVIELFNDAYYDRNINGYHRLIVEHPETVLDDWGKFSGGKIFDTVRRYIDTQLNFINALKTEKAKSNRFIKIAEVIQVAMDDTANSELKNFYQKLQSDILSKTK